jgi:hypothetical protein
MPHSIPDAKRQEVTRLRQSGKTRDQIAKEVGIGTGTVSNILKDHHNTPYISPKHDASTASSKIRSERAPSAIAEKASVEMLATDAGLNHDTSKLDGLKVMPPEVQARNNRDLAGQEPLDNNLSRLPSNLSKSEERRFIVMPESTYERQKQEEKNNIDAEIRQKREEKNKLETDNTEQTAEKERISHEVDDALRDSTITIKAIDEYAHYREELHKHGLSANDIPRLIHTLINLKKEGYNTGKIIARASAIETLEDQVRGLKQRFSMLKKKGAIYQEALQTCEHLASTGINVSQMELPVLYNTIQETACFCSMSLPEAARRLFTELSRYTRTQEKQREIGILDSVIISKKLDLQALDHHCAHRTIVYNALSRLLWNGVTEQQIVYFDNLLVNNWDKVDLESLPGDLMQYGRIKYAIKQAEAELNFLNKEVERHEIWLKNTTQMMFVAATRNRWQRPNPALSGGIRNPSFTDLKDTNLNKYNTHELQEIYNADGKLLSGN